MKKKHLVGYAFISPWLIGFLIFVLMAASCVFTIPIIILFFLAQKTFIQGISTTGGKG